MLVAAQATLLTLSHTVPGGLLSQPGLAPRHAWQKVKVTSGICCATTLLKSERGMPVTSGGTLSAIEGLVS